ncbi:MAG: glycosyltransferase, partial [Bacilli bacterium]|nr:glycosyltransferase [Bacilli bacterium]
MKILMVTQFYYPERFSTTDIAEELVKLGNEVTVLTGKPNYGYGYILKEYKKAKEENINGVRVLRTNLFPRKHSRLSIIRNYLSFHRNAKRKVKSLDDDFDIVLSISLSPVISIAPAIKYAKKHHVPHVLYCQDLWPESTVVTHAVRKNSLVYKILYRWSKSLYEKCDEIIISSPSFKDYFNNVLKISDKKFPVV